MPTSVSLMPKLHKQVTSAPTNLRITEHVWWETWRSNWPRREMLPFIQKVCWENWRMMSNTYIYYVWCGVMSDCCMNDDGGKRDVQKKMAILFALLNIRDSLFIIRRLLLPHTLQYWVHHESIKKMWIVYVRVFNLLSLLVYNHFDGLT